MGEGFKRYQLWGDVNTCWSNDDGGLHWRKKGETDLLQRGGRVLQRKTAENQASFRFLGGRNRDDRSKRRSCFISLNRSKEKAWVPAVTNSQKRGRNKD